MDEKKTKKKRKSTHSEVIRQFLRSEVQRNEEIPLYSEVNVQSSMQTQYSVLIVCTTNMPDPDPEREKESPGSSALFQFVRTNEARSPIGIENCMFLLKLNEKISKTGNGTHVSALM